MCQPYLESAALSDSGTSLRKEYSCHCNYFNKKIYHQKFNMQNPEIVYISPMKENMF